MRKNEAGDVGEPHQGKAEAVGGRRFAGLKVSFMGFLGDLAGSR
jgi:hypothetical protein